MVASFDSDLVFCCDHDAGLVEALGGPLGPQDLEIGADRLAASLEDGGGDATGESGEGVDPGRGEEAGQAVEGGEGEGREHGWSVGACRIRRDVDPR